MLALGFRPRWSALGTCPLPLGYSPVLCQHAKPEAFSKMRSKGGISRPHWVCFPSATSYGYTHPNLKKLNRGIKKKGGEGTWKWNNQTTSAEALCGKRHRVDSFLHHLPAEWFGVYGISLKHSFSFWKHSKRSINRALVKQNDHAQRLSPLWNLAQCLILGCSNWLLAPLAFKGRCLHFYLPLNLSYLIS